MPYSVEVKTDAWALSRLHRPPQRAELEAMGFRHLGYVFTQVPGMAWERAAVGYTTEVLVDEAGTSLVELDLFFDVGLIRIKTLLEDGTIVGTGYVPAESEIDAMARLTFASRPWAGRHTEDYDAWDGPRLWARHQDRVAQFVAKRGCAAVRHGDLTGFFAMDLRGLAIANASADLFNVLTLGGAGMLAGTLATLVSLWCSGILVGRATFGLVVCAVILVVFVVPWTSLAARFTRLPLEPASSMVKHPDIQAQVGDHAVVRGRVEA